MNILYDALKDVSLPSKRLSEKLLADALAKAFKHKGIKFSREVRLLYPEPKYRSYKQGYLDGNLVWFNGLLYSVIVADFLLEETVIELKYRRGLASPFHLKRFFNQATKYLAVPGIKQSLLIIYEHREKQISCWNASDKKLLNIIDIHPECTNPYQEYIKPRLLPYLR